MKTLAYSKLTIDGLATMYAKGQNEKANAVDAYMKAEVLKRTSAVDVLGEDNHTYLVERPSIGIGYNKATVVFEGTETINEAIDQMVKEYNEYEAVINGEMAQEWAGSYCLDRLY